MLELIKGTLKMPLSMNNTENKKWMLRLYVAGQTHKSIIARANLHRICEQHMPDKYHVDVIDLLENPQLAKEDQIIAIPTLVRNMPAPMRKIIGDLSNTEKVLMGLDLSADT
ncbi:circadian clock KaiB family protein [Undibacterium sp. Ji83W]|uniref:circadian clock KaiB family protein n=1 Tax=Undibacterium sp. Ji83W TaxID=3413043 RepID=UPI003BF1CB27